MKKIQLGGYKRKRIAGYALVDDKDYDWLNQWQWQFDGRYVCRQKGSKENRKKIYMHREILKAKKG